MPFTIHQSVSKIMLNKKVITLTFDDTPYDTTSKLLDMLKSKDVRATFFMIGNKIKKNPDLVRRAANEGHDVAWHSMEHNITAFSKKEDVYSDFAMAQPLLDSIGCNHKIKYVRCPGGHISEDIAHAANENSFKIVNWSHYSFDDSVKSEATPKERCDKAFSSTYGIRDGDIFLIHPSSEEIIQGVALLIDRLKSENFEILSLSEHFERKNGGINVCYGPIF